LTGLKLIIGNKAYSSWSLRGWLAVRQSGLPFEEVVVPLYDEHWTVRREARDIAPSGGKVPILWDGDIPVWDSLAIIDYLDARTAGTRFWPKDTEALAFARSICAEMHSGYQALRSQHGMNVRRIFPTVPPTPEVAADIDRIMQLWAQARARFGGAGAFLFGDFGAADIMFAPIVSRLTTYGLPVAPFARAYVDAVTNHPWMQDWIAAAQEEPWVIEKWEVPQV
jgi:glutathione S-transferase